MVSCNSVKLCGWMEKIRFTVIGRKMTVETTHPAQRVATPIEFAIPRAFEGKISLMKNHGMEPK